MQYITQDFEYIAPQTLDEALSIMDRFGPDAFFLAGGTDIVLNLKNGDIDPKAVVDIKHIPALRRLELIDDDIFIGATVPLVDIINSAIVTEHIPILRESIMTVGAMGIRNRATLVGNICAAIPSMDSGPALYIYEAQVHVLGPDGKRTVPAMDWCTGPKCTVIAPHEIVTGISIPKHPQNHAGCYLKRGRYRGEDLAQVGMAVMVDTENIYRVSFSAVGPTVKRAHHVEEVLSGKTLSNEVIEEAKGVLDRDISPISDIRASAEYRRHVAGVMLERGIVRAHERLNGNGPAYGEDMQI